MIQDYSRAKKLGERAFRRALAKGAYPYLPALEEMVEGVDRLPQISLGLAEIPLELVVGTLTGGRQSAFASNFMPLMSEKTEFAAKWSNLYDAQVEEGIRDPVKAYEFMNRFYVEEGNKRVSVLRYVGAASVPANVIRIRPPKDESVQSRIYYEYLDFYQATHLFEITFSAPGRYAQLAAVLGQNLRDPWPEELLEKLRTGYAVFRNAYLARGGERLSLTVGDALLIYLDVYSLDSLLTGGREEIEKRIARLWREFVALSLPDGIALIENRDEAEAHVRQSHLEKAARIVEDTARIVEETVEKTEAVSAAGAAQIAGAVAGAAAGLTGGAGAAAATAQAARKAVRDSLSSAVSAATEDLQTPLSLKPRKYSPAHPLKAAFFYEKDPESSGWVYGHELGRNHLREAFGSLVETMHFDHCGEEAVLQEAFETAKAEGCDVIFFTSPSFTKPALRFALDNPQVRVLGCGFNQTARAIRFYHGRMYEAKYLMGALAASLTDDHRIGYAAGRRDPAAVSSINAFALGAQLVDPGCRIELEWTGEPGGSVCHTDAAGMPEGPVTAALERRRDSLPAGAPERVTDRPDRIRHGIHVFSDLDMIRPKDEDRRYGLYIIDEQGGSRRLAAPVWNWGVFYEIAVRRILDGSYDDVSGQLKDRALNYWLGLSSGIIDVILSGSLPAPSYRLVEMLRRGIVEGHISPFEGELRAQDKTVHGERGKTLTAAEIMSMDWLVENVDGSIETFPATP